MTTFWGSSAWAQHWQWVAAGGSDPRWRHFPGRVTSATRPVPAGGGCGTGGTAAAVRALVAAEAAAGHSMALVRCWQCPA